MKALTSGAPDHTIKIYLEKALGYTDKIPVWEVAPVTGRYYATPPTLTDEGFGPALLDANGRLIVAVSSVTGWPSDYPDAAVATLLGGGLPAALDTGALKVKEQSPITGYATSANQTTIIGHIDGIEALLAGGLPSTLDTDALKIREQNWPSDFPDSAVATLLAGGLPSALDTDALKVREQNWPSEYDVDLTKVAGTAQTADDWTARFKVLNDDTVKGLLRSVGDAGATPTNTTGKTVLEYLDEMETWLNYVETNTSDTYDSTNALNNKFAAVYTLSDTLSNPNVSGIGAYMLGWRPAPTSKWARPILDGNNIFYTDLSHINQTALTARDWSADFQTLTDNTIAGRYGVRHETEFMRYTQLGYGFTASQSITAIGAGAARNSILENPAGSGVTVYLVSLSYFHTNGNPYRVVIQHNVTRTGGTLISTGCNRLIGDANAPVLDFYNSATYTGGCTAYQWCGENRDYKKIMWFEEPIIIPEGYAINLEANNLGASTSTPVFCFEWYEV